MAHNYLKRLDSGLVAIPVEAVIAKSLKGFGYDI